MQAHESEAALVPQWNSISTTTTERKQVYLRVGESGRLEDTVLAWHNQNPGFNLQHWNNQNINKNFFLFLVCFLARISFWSPGHSRTNYLEQASHRSSVIHSNLTKRNLYGVSKLGKTVKTEALLCFNVFLHSWVHFVWIKSTPKLTTLNSSSVLHSLPNFMVCFSHM